MLMSLAIIGYRENYQPDNPEYTEQFRKGRNSCSFCPFSSFLSEMVVCQYILDACTCILKICSEIVRPKKYQPKLVLIHLTFTFCIFNFILLESSVRESLFQCCGSGSGLDPDPGGQK
jgi:hypothetical protein